MFNYRSFYIILALSIGLSTLIALFNLNVLPYLIEMKKSVLFALYSPLLIVIGGLFIYLFKDYAIVAKVLKKLKLIKT